MKESPKKAAKKRRRESVSALGATLASPTRAAIVVFVVAFLAYANSIGNDFVWDDYDLIEGNPQIGELTPANVGNVFFSNFWQGYQNAGYYRPLVTLTYHIQYKVFGDNPAGFHFANVMWHAIACVLVFFFLNLLFGNAALAGVAALVFALHPLHTENVTWISGRTDVLSTLWAMASLVFYVLFRRRGNVLLLAGTLGAFALSLLAKESSAFVPFIVVLLELPPLRGLTRRGAARNVPAWGAPAGIVGMFAVLAGYLALRAHVLGIAASTYPAYAPGLLGAVALPASVFAGYIYKLLFPFLLNAEWDAPVPASFANLHVIAGFVLAAAIVAAVIRYRRVPWVVLGAGFFLLGVGPVLNIIPIGEISAERFLYFPILGFAIVLGGLFARPVEALAASRPGSRAMVWVLAAVLVAYGARVVTRNPVWANEKVLFTATVKAAPDSPRARVNLGDVARKEGRIGDAIKLYKQSIEIKPDYTLGLSNLAGVYVQQGRPDLAEPLMERAVEAEPKNAGLLANLGSLYIEQGEPDKALDPLQRAVALAPDHPTAQFNLGLVLFGQGRMEDARGHFERVVSKGGAYEMASYYLAEIETSLGNTVRARQYAAHFLRTHPRSDQYSRRAKEIVGSAPPQR